MQKPSSDKGGGPRLMGRFLVYFTLGAVSVFMVFLAFAYQRFGLELEKQQQTESPRLELAAKTLDRDLRAVLVNLRRLANSQILREYLEDDSPDKRRRLEVAFVNLAAQAAIYDQVRYIDRSGQERVRVNFNNGAPRPVDSAELQNKSGRYYFRQAIILRAGEVYISPLDLNMEHGIIERPLKPIVRLAVPLFRPGSNSPAGILILNYLAVNLLVHFQEVMTGSWGTPMLLNAQGYWLHAPDPGDAWGFMLDHEHSFATRYPAAWEVIAGSLAGTQRTANGLFSFVTLRPLADILSAQSNGLEWKIVSRIGTKAVHFSPLAMLRDNIAASLGLALLTFVLSLQLASLRTTNIQKAIALQANEDRLRELIEQAADAIFIADQEGRYTEANSAACSLLGFRREEIVGKTIVDFIPDADVERLWESKAQMMRGEKHVAEWTLRCKDGSHLPVEVSARILSDGSWQGIVRDISERKQIEAQLSHLAHHDPLTGLANRLAFLANLEQALERAKRHNQKLALLFLDLDRFKLINDTLGHAAGDELLKVIAERLKHNVRAEDMAARLGGDEFTLILEEIRNPEDAASLAQKLISAVTWSRLNAPPDLFIRSLKRCVPVNTSLSFLFISKHVRETLFGFNIFQQGGEYN